MTSLYCNDQEVAAGMQMASTLLRPFSMQNNIFVPAQDRTLPHISNNPVPSPVEFLQHHSHHLQSYVPVARRALLWRNLRGRNCRQGLRARTPALRFGFIERNPSTNEHHPISLLLHVGPR